MFPTGANAAQKGLLLLSVTLSPFGTIAGELTPPQAEPPKVAAASNEGELAMKAFSLPSGFKAELIAAEPLLANPVAFDIDEQGRFYVAETFRLHAGVSDIRGHMDWLDEDLAARTVDDRIALMKRHEGDKFPDYEKFSDRVKFIWDSNGDGKADQSTVFADGFNTALDGIGSGVLARNGKVYYANIPNLWLLQDTNNDGVADKRDSLHFGYGVRVGFLGHDLHGLIMGPDGKLYFSVGDRGSSIEIDGKRVGEPDTGSVFRCNPDGSELEVFAFGLRNPQELAFDEHGNLFTGDNNSDGGDRARIVHVVEGGDSGWRIGWQFIERPNARGPWNSERLWHPQWEGQAAYIVPPITNMTDGPSGFAYNPGTGLPEEYDNHFFLVDFHGSRSSGVHSFTLEPNGAGFTISNAKRFIWDALPTDVAFGIEPGIYFSDWVQGWGMTGKGRIYRVFSEDVDVKASEFVKEELAADYGQRSERQLGRLLAAGDMRVRQKAQFELAKRGEDGIDVFRRVAKSRDNELARLHSLWGLGQVGRQLSTSDQELVLKPLIEMAREGSDEVRAQAVKVLGDLRAPTALRTVIAAAKDSSARVRFFAAQALGKIGSPEGVPALVSILRENNNQDVYLRHAAAIGLAGINDMESLNRAAKDDSAAVRLGVVLALRRLERAEIASFLHDPDPRVVAEAARAINDLPISGAISDLAVLEQKITSSSGADIDDALLRRVVNANYRFGTEGSAKALGRLAANEKLPEAIRAEAVGNLAKWVNPSGRDNVTGLWRPVVGARKASDAAAAIQPHIAQLLRGPAAVQAAAAEAAATLRLQNAGELLFTQLTAESSAPGAKVEAIRGLSTLNDPRLGEAAQIALKDKDENVRKEALRVQAALKPAGALAQIRSTLQEGTLGEKQSAFGTLANMDEPGVNELLGQWMDQLLAGKVDPRLHLDVLEAAGKRKAPALKAKLDSYQARIAADDHLGKFRVALAGGNAEEGRKIFFERPEAACVRCHRIKGQAEGEGGEVGPDLTTIGATRTREYLLESIVTPNKQIAQGFESLIVTTKDGLAYAGVVQKENEVELVLNSPEDGIITLKKGEITSRDRGLSSMPEGMEALLSKQDLRNLVEYLSSLK